MTDAQPLVSIDVVPLRFNKESGVIEFATGARIFEPFIGEQALPGVLLQAGESVLAGATRALASKAGLPPGALLQLGAFDATNRDPRGANISIAFLSAQEFDVELSSRAQWNSESLELPFDHSSIVAAAFERVQQALWNDVPVTRGLLGETFTTADALALKSPSSNPTNAVRWLKSWGELEESKAARKTSGAGRPAKTWQWVS